MDGKTSVRGRSARSWSWDRAAGRRLQRHDAPWKPSWRPLMFMDMDMPRPAKQMRIELISVKKV
eukprot:34114-Heterocapsa_arctica.AAC.1